jgi:hypothetical protein
MSTAWRRSSGWQRGGSPPEAMERGTQRHLDHALPRRLHLRLAHDLQAARDRLDARVSAGAHGVGTQEERGEAARLPRSCGLLDLEVETSRARTSAGGPELRGRLSATRHQPGDRALREVEAQLEELAVDSGRAAERVGERHLLDEGSQSWKTFLENHVADLASVDFFVVPTVTF